MKKTLKSTMTLTLILILLVSACTIPTYAQEVGNGVAISEKNFPDEVFREHLLNGFHYIWDDDGNIISSYSLDEPIVYTYDCGTDANGDVTLTVTLNLN